MKRSGYFSIGLLRIFPVDQYTDDMEINQGEEANGTGAIYRMQTTYRTERSSGEAAIRCHLVCIGLDRFLVSALMSVY